MAMILGKMLCFAVVIGGCITSSGNTKRKAAFIQESNIGRVHGRSRHFSTSSKSGVVVVMKARREHINQVKSVYTNVVL